MIIGVILAILWFILILYIDIQSDYKRLETNTINHKRGAILRSVALLPTYMCLLFPVYGLAWWIILLKAISVGIVTASVWWEFFDGLLNKKRGKPWRYNGSDDDNDAVLDNFLQKYTPKQQMMIKWGLILISIISYICIIHLSK